MADASWSSGSAFLDSYGRRSISAPHPRPFPNSWIGEVTCGSANRPDQPWIGPGANRVTSAASFLFRLHDFDDTWTSPTLITSTADRAQQHAPLHLLVFMILLISTTDPDNAHTSTNDQKVGHRSPIPSPTPHPPVFACGGHALWTPANTSHALRRLVWNSVIGRTHMDFHGICFFAHYTLLLVHEVECILGDYYAHGGVRFDSFAIFYFPPERAWQQKLL
jgi:hypothetical protein